MATVSVSIDTQISIYERVGSSTAIGFQSEYTETPHPNTGNTIKGFAWDERRFASELDDNSAFTIPTLWDATTANVVDNLQVGIGDRNDLKVVGIQKEYLEESAPWRPVVNHGYYYYDADEFYLFSDDGIATTVQASGIVVASGIITPEVTVSGGNYTQMEYNPKPGIPIQANQYEWDENTGTYLIANRAYKVTDFTGQFIASGEKITRVADQIVWENVNTSRKEFLIDDLVDPPIAYFNQQMAEKVGEIYETTVSGLNLAELSLLENVGTTSSDANQEFHLRYSPIPEDAPIQVLTDYQGTNIQEWSVVDTLASGLAYEVTLDRDLGILSFGSDDEGGLPLPGSTVRVGYYKSFSLEYEPIYSRDEVYTNIANTNPTARFKANGFVFLKKTATDIASLELSADLSEISEDLYGPLNIGNTYARIVATAKTESGAPVEGATIYFELIAPEVGSYSGNDSATALTNSVGEARALFNPPQTIDQLGGATNVVTTVSGVTTLSIDDFYPPDNSNLYLFQVAKEDTILGIPKSQLLDYYEEYLTDEGYTDGPGFSFSIASLGSDLSWITGALEEKIRWEVWNREVHSLITPTTYEDGDLLTGKKSVIATVSTTAINPHTGTTPAVVPVQPSGYDVTSSGVDVYFDYALPDVYPTASGSATKSYFVVGPTDATLRAYAINERTGDVITSNEIQVRVDIPEASQGAFEIDAINTVASGVITSGLLYNSPLWTMTEADLEPVLITTASGLLPLGFRLYNTGVTLSSALDGVTFLDLQPQSSPFDNISHTFEVDV